MGTTLFNRGDKPNWIRYFSKENTIALVVYMLAGIEAITFTCFACWNKINWKYLSSRLTHLCQVIIHFKNSLIQNFFWILHRTKDCICIWLKSQKKSSQCTSVYTKYKYNRSADRTAFQKLTSLSHILNVTLITLAKRSKRFICAPRAPPPRPTYFSALQLDVWTPMAFNFPTINEEQSKF